MLALVFKKLVDRGANDDEIRRCAFSMVRHYDRRGVRATISYLKRNGREVLAQSLELSFQDPANVASA